jgi:hypothetical protein
MLRISIVVATAAAALTTAPLATPAKAEAVKLAQGVDVQIGQDRDDRYYRDRYRYNRDTTVGIGPGGVTVGPPTATDVSYWALSRLRPSAVSCLLPSAERTCAYVNGQLKAGFKYRVNETRRSINR